KRAPPSRHIKEDDHADSHRARKQPTVGAGERESTEQRAAAGKAMQPVAWRAGGHHHHEGQEEVVGGVVWIPKRQRRANPGAIRYAGDCSVAGGDAGEQEQSPGDRAPRPGPDDPLESGRGASRVDEAAAPQQQDAIISKRYRSQAPRQRRAWRAGRRSRTPWSRAAG